MSAVVQYEAPELALSDWSCDAVEPSSVMTRERTHFAEMPGHHDFWLRQPNPHRVIYPYTSWASLFSAYTVTLMRLIVFVALP